MDSEKRQHKGKCDIPTYQLGYSDEKGEDRLLGFAPYTMSIVYTSIEYMKRLLLELGSHNLSRGLDPHTSFHHYLHTTT